MNKMVFAFDEARARRDGVEPASLWAMVDGWVEECVKTHHGKYRKEEDPEGGIAYVGIGADIDWVPIFGGVYICASFSDVAAKYCVKFDFFYDEDGEEFYENPLVHLFEKSDLYQQADRS